MTTRTNHSDRNSTPQGKAPDLIAFHVSQRDKKAFWTRIGAAWDHEDAKGLTIYLDTLPVSGGKIVLREPLPKDDESSKKGRS